MAVTVFADPFGSMQQGRNVESQITARDTNTAMNQMAMQQQLEEMARQKEYMKRTMAPPAPPGSPQALQQNQSASDMIYSKIGEIDKNIKIAGDLGLNTKVDQLYKERDAMLSRYALAQQREQSVKERVEKQKKESIEAVSRFATSFSDILSGDSPPEDKVQQLQELDSAAREENPDAYKVLSGGTGKIDFADPRTFNRMTALSQQAIPPEKRAELAMKKTDEDRKKARDEQLKKDADVRAALTRELRDIERERLSASKPAATKDEGAAKGLHGEEYLNTLPEEDQGLIKGIAEGRINPTSLSVKGGHREQILKQVTQYNPGYNQAKYAVYAAVQKDFTSGVASRNVTAINTAISHMGTLNALSRALDNNDTKALNAIVNSVANQTGDPRINNVQLASGAVGNELMRVFRQVGASEAETKDWEKRFGTSSSPAQFKEGIKVAAELLKGRIEAVDDQWKRGMDSKQGYPNLLSEKSRRTLNKLGVEVKEPDKPKSEGGAMSLDAYLDAMEANQGKKP